jgi:hypothetical protein
MNPANVAASVRARLLNRARESKRPFQELLQYYALERFLYRFGISEHKERFILKGALMLRVWNAPMFRPTKDIDLLGIADNSIENIEMIVRSVCSLPAADDGILFDPESVKGELIKEESKYSGVRVKFVGTLEKAKVPMQIDVGFGDVVFPAPKEAAFPTIFDFEAPRLKMYPQEAVIAEKLHTMVDRGTLNSRMKDFFDIQLLSKQFTFDGETLVSAVKQTFENRNTSLTSSPVIFEDSFSKDENISKQWRAFLNKGMRGIAPDSIEDVMDEIKAFLLPIIEAAAKNAAFKRYWTPAETDAGISKWKHQ